MQLDGIPGIELIGCLARHADASGRPGFAGSVVAVAGDRLEKIGAALPVSQRLTQRSNAHAAADGCETDTASSGC